MNFTRADFPEGFDFGVATSAYQIEGHAAGGAGQTHWDSFAATPGNVVRFEDGALACDHYHRMDEDLDLIRDLGADVYRFSTSWARVLPEGRGRPNVEGLDFYDRLVDGLLERGIKPAVTLYHWELPQPLADLGGWRNADMPDWFADFTEVIMSRIGDRTWSAAPINEPWCVSWLSHFEGHHAPGMRDIRAAARAMHHVLLSHGRATQVMKGLGVSNLGAVCNFEWATPLTNSAADVTAATRYDAIYNRFFLGGLFKGEYPAEVLEGLEPHLPKGWQDDFATIRSPLDWVGVNYYTRKRLRGTDAPWPAYDYAGTQGPLTDMDWEIYPRGLQDFLTRTAREYTGDLPIYVTENGMASAPTPDPERIAYLSDHLDAVRAAIAEGAPVAGYFVWSLLDNYEWSLGYEKRFGLVHVDFETLARTPKASYHALAKWWA
ncbi:GH1 family beta-glucosidase [Gymnodinialimonas ceratoperidinii]|uniref:Beta-glucosidase n=1 Tax=Gymnodinialimonas ceratoperidinii TaxID=2856823 RepID=A0A8F6TVG9_9RHOB|nr:GH1 family beta-glucosidase [Gymnodinialimonas ceratoperidinii]QXT38643.1 beta-glucosidase [Gymnodinialimonas ceratoperidinii]